MPELFAFDRGDKLRELKRELRMREEVYERSVAAKKMRASLAEYRIGIIKAIITDYEAGESHERG